MKNFDPNAIINRWEQESRKRSRRIQTGSKASQDPRQVLADRAVQEVIRRLELVGLEAIETPANERHDLEVAGLRVEVKASSWNQQKGRNGGRYQAHYHNQADIVVWGVDAPDGWHFFIVPVEEVGKSLTIRTQDPAEYNGKYAQYLEAWELVA